MSTELYELCQKAAVSGEKTGMCRLQHNLPKLVIERFGNTVVLSDHSPDGRYREMAVAAEFPALLYKWRNSKNFRERNGVVLSGIPDAEIVERAHQNRFSLLSQQRVQ